MATQPKPRILPMKAAGTQHMIDRIYRESGQYQWVRETFVNAVEAGATRIQYGIEWQAVENLGVYRRTIADNGKGMTENQITRSKSLGLIGMQERARSWGGRVMFLATPGQGTTVTVRVPMVNATEETR